MKIEPDDISIILNVGELLELESKQYTEAINQYKHALSLTKDEKEIEDINNMMERAQMSKNETYKSDQNVMDIDSTPVSSESVCVISIHSDSE